MKEHSLILLFRTHDWPRFYFFLFHASSLKTIVLSLKNLCIQFKIKRDIETKLSKNPTTVRKFQVALVPSPTHRFHFRKMERGRHHMVNPLGLP